ncbi:MAG TPA: FAD-dependent oxidoreductase, partial [Solirubrobacteraceae bacterium]
MGQARAIDADVCVVGAGITGLAHAFEARARGLSVTVLERHARCVGASVRNFGHVIVSAMADGPALECALTARERWLSLGRRAGLEVHQAGTLIAARSEDELEVLAGVAADPRRGARLLAAE